MLNLIPQNDIFDSLGNSALRLRLDSESARLRAAQVALPVQKGITKENSRHGPSMVSSRLEARIQLCASNELRYSVDSDLNSLKAIAKNEAQNKDRSGPEQGSRVLHA